MRKTYLTLILIFCLRILSFSQTDSARLTVIASKLEQLAATHPVEKVYLHFNKPAYTIGDTIWFKGYVTVGDRHQPSALSGVLYIELIDGKDKIIKSLLLKSYNGLSVGDFAINDKLTPGNYRIRAYTNWMRNAGSDYFFNKTISISNIKTAAVFITSSIDVTVKNSGLNTKLTYTDKFGRPYIHKAVNYEVKGTDSTLLYKGAAVTDDNGNIAVALSDKILGTQKQVNIINHIKLVAGSIVDKTVPLSLQKDDADIQFFPEGGQLVNDVRSKVAFKAIGANGLGIEVKGVVTDNEKNEVAYFSSQHAGMGVFALTPQAGKTYTATVTLADNSTVSVKLPLAVDKGFVLAVNNNDTSKVTIRIATNAATLHEKQNTAFYIVGQSGGKLYYTTAGKLVNTSFTAVLPKNKFPTGIVQFTLFSSTGEPLNERVVFVQNTNQLNLSLKTPKTTYAPKEKVNMIFSAKDTANKPALGSFSLTVFNEDPLIINENEENSIFSDILLTSDLKGYIEGSNYYFNHISDQTRSDLDVLMLTQGYSRFEWKEIMAGKYPPLTYKPEKYLSISGILTTPGGKPVANGKVSVLSLENSLAIDTVTNAEGKFNLTRIELPDSAKLIVQARNANDGRNVNVKLDNNRVTPSIYKDNIGDVSISLTPPFSKMLINGNADTTRLAANIMADNTKGINKGNRLKNVNLKEVDINVNQKELAPWLTVNPHSSNLNGPGHADQTILARELENCTDISSCIQARIPGLIIKTDTTTLQRQLFFVRHAAQSITSPPAVLFIVDGVVIGTSLDALDDDVIVSTVATIEVLNSNNYLNVYGSNASGGALIITTKVGSEDNNKVLATKSAPGVSYAKFTGFYTAREFYVPKYTPANVTTTDTRTAIYWNPYIITGNSGSLSVDYFNSDIKGTYRAVVEGIDNDGNIGRYVYRYKVE